jgi:translation elongation factor EF-Tu-like GTPase
MKLVQTYRLKAHITLSPSGQGVREKAIFNGYRPALKFGGKRLFSCQITLPGIQLNPGESAFVDIALIPAEAIPKNLTVSDSFTIFDGSRAIGSGHIIQVDLSTKAASQTEVLA